MNTLRCSICDKVNNSTMDNHSGWIQQTRGFVTDPQDHLGFAMLCVRCNEEIIDASREYFIDIEDKNDS